MSRNLKSAAGNQDAEPALTPKLRFPEFRDAPAWGIKTLEALLEISATYGIVTAGAFQQRGIPMLRGGDIKDGQIGDGVPLVTAEIHSQYKRTILEADDVVISLVGYPGEAAVVPPHYVGANISRAVGLLRLKDVLSARYLVSFLNSPTGRQTVLKPSAGSAQVVVNLKQLNGLPIPTPSESEQQKIAECLNTLNEVIAAQNQKLDALKTHKKGLMQQLFPREGETLPRLRFPEFQNFGEWEVRELSDFITERIQYPKEKVPLFSLTIEDGVTPKTARYERSFLVNDEADAYKLVLPNDFAFNPMNLRFGAIGRHTGIEKVVVSKYYNIFSCDRTVDPRFCEMYFRSDGMVAFYDDRAIGSLIEKRRVHFAAFLKFNIRFPRLPEQQRIADCLITLNDLITAHSAKLSSIKTHKKGLMQQLFPSPEAVEA